MKLSLHYLVYGSGSRTIAHCLDFDLVASAESTAEAVRRLGFLVKSHVAVAVRDGNAVSLQHRAPEQYWERFRQLKEAGLQDFSGGSAGNVVTSPETGWSVEMASSPGREPLNALQ
ncbi:MAG: hypothetical protein U0Q16_09235 [Bryobacteraceae bacterium]